ncbi:MAG: hypothetical protein EB829_03345 [Nitrosopumilus sp. H8]|nr:MAG: hypothetical protein EB829_03345 [Nitrosopumilus sp. H8]
MIRQRTAFVITAVGILVSVSALVMYDAGLLGVQHVIVSGAQANPWDTAFMTKASDMIFEGTVKSTETKHVYEPPITRSPEEHKRIVKERADIIMNITGEPTPPSNYEWPILPNGNLLIEPERHVPYNYVTVQVTEWLKDSTGQFADQVIVRDYTTGATGKIGGEPAWFEYRDAVGYSDGEKGIFFAEYIEGELTTHGALQVFRYNDDGLVYLPYSDDFEEPFVADELRADIRANLEPLNKTAQNIN